MNNFIEEYDLVSPEDCKKIIDFFEDRVELQRDGTVGEKDSVDKKHKDSTDMHLDFCNSLAINEIILDGLGKALEQYKEKYYYMDTLCPWSIYSSYNLQRYYPNQGYPAIHQEQGPKGKDASRMLVWSLYLNDVSDGGTHFHYQRQLVSAKAGKVILFPAAWTHMHSGQISPTTTKYIATGWFLYSQ